MKITNRRYYSLIAGLVLVTIAVLVFTRKAYTKPKPAFKPEVCYKMQHRTLPDISSAHAPRADSIFFVDTSCGPRLELSPRQACALESAAHTNPKRSVYLLYISPELEEGALTSLRAYENLHVVRLNVEKYLQDSPVEKLFRQMRRWKNVQKELGHVLRFLVLWRYGGVYLDLDAAVVLRSLEPLPPSCAALEDSTSVGCSVLRFAASGPGHDMARQCLEQLGSGLREDIPGANCVGLITRVLKTACNAYEAIDMEGVTCEGVSVLSGEAFYPLRYKKYFYSDESEQNIQPIAMNGSYVAHPWDEFSKIDKHVGRLKNGESYYAGFVQRFCPRTYAGHKEFF